MPPTDVSLSGAGGRGQSGCEPSIEVIMKKQKRRGSGWCVCGGGGVRVDLNQELMLESYCENAKKKQVGVGGGSGRGEREPRIEVIVKMQKKVRGWVRSGGPIERGGVRVDVNQEFKLLLNGKKSGGVRSGGEGSGWM